MRKFIFGVMFLIYFSVLYGQTPHLSTTLPASDLAGNTVCFDLSLTNSGDPGYNPYIRLILPADLHFVSAEYMSMGVTVTNVGTFTSSNSDQLTDPKTGDVITGPDGGSFYLLEPPIGTLVENGPTVVITVCVTIDPNAQIGTPLEVRTQPVYELGDSPTGENGPIVGDELTQSDGSYITPQLWTFSKQIIAPETESVPGSNFPYTVMLVVDVADGKTVSNVSIHDVLGSESQYTGNLNITGGNNSNVVEEPDLSTPGGNLEVSFDSIDGTSSSQDVVITFTAYLTDVLDHSTCDSRNFPDTATADGEYPAGTSLPQLTANAQFEGDHVCVQKSVSPSTVSPGDTVTYTFNFQVTQFDTATALVLTDTIPDGLQFDSHQSLVVNGNSYNITPTLTNNADGTTTVVYDIHAVTGDLAPASTGTVSFTAKVLETYHDGTPIRENDSMSSGCYVTYSIQGGASDCTEDSSAGVSVKPITIEKTILNPQQYYYPGDTVKFKLTMTIPSGDAKNVVFKDYFPLPVFDVTTIDTTWGNDIKLASDDTWGHQPDSINVSGSQNLLEMQWNNVETDPSQQVVISVEVDIKIVDKAFADNLKLTNILEASAENSENIATNDLTPAPINVRAPELVITKGVYSASNPNAEIEPPNGELPVDGDVGGVDAADDIYFYITVENVGGAPAYYVIINDPAVSGLTNAHIVSVKDGNGNDLDYRDPNDVDPPNPPTLPIPTDLTNGIRLDNPLAANDGTVGPPYADDTVIIVYKLTVDSNVNPEQDIVNEAGVTWASLPGAEKFPRIADTSTVTIAAGMIKKSVKSIIPGPNTDINSRYVTTGDTVTYMIHVELPEGETKGLRIYDHLPAGFEYQSYTLDTSSFSGNIDTNPTVNVSGTVETRQRLNFYFNNIDPTYVDPDNDQSNNGFDLYITCLVKDSTANVGYPSRQHKYNYSRLYYDGSSNIHSGYTLYFVEPHLTVTKTMNPSSGLEAGDTVTVTINVQNDGTGKAYDVSVSDTLNQYGDLFDLTTVTEGTTPANYTYNYTSPTVTYTMNSGSLDPGNTDTFTFTAQVKDDVVVGSTYRNDAIVNGDNQDGSVTDERSYNPQATTNANTLHPTIAKEVLSTSESFTSGNDVAIGERITYRVTVNVPEGVTKASSTPLVTDQLPAGFEYVSGSAVYYGVYDTGLSSANYGNLPPNPTAITPNVNGQTLEFDFGDLTNTDNDSNTEQLIVEYTVQVLNTVDNNRGDSKTNHAYFNYQNKDGNPQSQTDSETLYIAEPDLSVSKSANPTVVTGGSVTYTAVISNNTSSHSTYAWEPVITDTLPSELTNVQIVSSVLSRGNTDLTASSSVVGNTITVDLSSLAASERYIAPGDTITVQYTADITGQANFEQVITNTAEVRATSLQGDYGSGNSAQGTPGSDEGERLGDGSTNTSGDAVNDLNASGSSSISVAQPSMTKSGGTDLQIGDTTTNTITVSVPVGNTSDFVITDTLPSGLTYTGQPITITIPPSVTVSNNPNTTPGAGTNPLTFDFGNVENNSGVAQDIVISYEVRADNVIGNQNGDLLTNTASLNYQGASAPVTSSTTSRVIEPNLEIVSQITSGAVGSDAGDTITYQITVSNTDSNATAYGVDLSSVIPADLLGANPTFFNITLSNPDNVQKTAGGTLGSSDYTITTTTNTNDILSWEAFNLPPNTSITITFSVQVVNDATAGESLTVNTSASYRSQQVAGSNTRDFTDGGDDDDDSVLNNYNESAQSTLTLNSDIAIQKSLSPGQTGNNYTIGDTVSFDLRVDVVEGTIPNVSVIDNLPSGMSFVQLVSIIAGNNISYDGTGNATDSGGQITFDLGNITNIADGDTTNDYLIIRFEAVVDDVSGNTDGVVLTNSAEVHSDSGNAGPVTYDINVVEPHLVITKTASDSAPPIGHELTFTVTVQHSSSHSDAYDVVVDDVIPSGMTYVVGSTTGQATVDETDPSHPVFDLGTITLADGSKTFQFKVKVNEDWTPGNPITNTVDLNYDGQAGTPSVERSYTGSDDETVTPTANTFIDATKTVSLVNDADSSGTVTPGDTLEYTVTLNNTDGDLTGVVFTDPLPSEVSYVAGSLTSTAGTVDETNPSILVVNIGNMASNDTVTITFRVTVNSGVAEGTVISNQGYVESDQTIREYTDEDGIDSNGDQPTDVVVGGQNREYSLYVWKFVELLNDNDNSNSITAGDTMRYYFIFYNDGNHPLTGVTLNDTIPAGLTVVSGSEYASSGTVTVNGNQISLTGMSIAVDDNEYVSVDVTIDSPLYDSDSDPSSETFVNQGTADSNETDSVPTDGNGDYSDGYQPTVFVAGDGSPAQPQIDVEKRWSLAVDNDSDGIVDPGDTIKYTIYIYNNGSVDAQNVRLSDTIPANTTLVSGSVTTSNGVVVSEDPVDVNITTIQAGSIEVVSFKVVIDPGTPDGTIIQNQATVTGDNFLNESSDDNGNDNDGINPTLTPVSTGGGSVGNYPYGLSKNIYSTSNPDTLSNNVAIGEEVTFEIMFSVPSGTVNEVAIEDTLPSGLSYVAGSSTLARVFDTGLTSSANPANINNAPSNNFVSLQDGTDISVNGNQIRLFFGDITNSDNDSNDESYILRFTAVVDNVNSNQQGTVLTNRAVLTYQDALGQDQSLPEVSASVVVVEPDIVVQKEAVSGGVGSTHGDTVRFRITVSNLSSTAYAYNVNLSDVIPHEFMGGPDGTGSGPAITNISINTSPGVVITATSQPVSLSDVVISSTVEPNDTISINPFTLPTSGTLSIEFDTVVHNDADLGSFVTNTANVNYTSLPSGGRNGSDGSGGLNDYVSGNSLSIQLCLNVFITATAENGTISPASIRCCDPDGTYTVTFEPNEGYHLSGVIIDGVPSCFCRTQRTYTFNGVSRDHTVHVIFTKSEDPVINSFVANRLSGVYPLNVTFTAEAYDPDGGDIVEYRWDFNNDGVIDVVTRTPNVSHIYALPGQYTATVSVKDNEGNVVKSFPITIYVKEANPVLLNDGLIGNSSVTTGFDVWAINYNPCAASGEIRLVDSKGNSRQIQSFTIAPNGKSRVRFEGNVEEGERLLVASDQRLIYYVDKKLNGVESCCYIGDISGNSLIIPHVAEEKDYWQTSAYISSLNLDSVEVYVAKNSLITDKDYFHIVDLNQFVSDNQVEKTCWGSVTSSSSSPFGSNNPLTGFISFEKNGFDGAFVEMPESGYSSCIFPHIPVEKDLFWTGMVVDNLENTEQNLTFTFYDSHGNEVLRKNLTVGGKEKLKGLFADLFPEVYGVASWAKIEGDGNFVCAEIFGVFPQQTKSISGGAVCGMLVSPETSKNFILPLLNSDSGHWTGLAIANPNNETASLTVKLMDGSGNTVAEKSITIDPFGQYKVVVDELFNSKIKSGGYLAVESNVPLSACEIEGNYDYSSMKAIVFAE